MGYYNRGGVLSPFTEKVESLNSRCKSDCPEDDIVTWVQYPLHQTLERGYCSELFGRLASSLCNSKPDINQGAPISMDNAGGRGMMSTVTENAKAALAVGAGRASGFVLSEGVEAFNKVKTIMQQAPCLQSNTSAFPALGMSDANSEPFCTAVQSGGLTHTTLLADKYPAYGALLNYPTNCMWSSVSLSVPTQDMATLPRSEEAGVGSTFCETSQVINPNGISKDSDRQAQSMHTQGRSYSLITEDCMRDASLHVASAGHWEALGSASYSAGMPARLAESCKGQNGCGDMHAEVPDVFLPSCSGGSQTSAEMSVKEVSSLGKQKLEDYDCQSKNAEVDSAEISQPQRRPSKRSRVAESHNLSEKRRRNRINEKLKTLQELIPNSSKTDKASILDEAIEYLKALQSQLQVMSARSGTKLSPMGFPLGLQHVQMTHPMGFGFPLVHAGMGIGMGVGLMDLQHGMDGRLFHVISAASPHFSLPYTATASLPSQTRSQPDLNMEAYQQTYIEPQMESRIEQGERLSTTPGVSKDR